MVLHYYCVLCLEGLMCAFTPLYCYNFDILLVNHFAKLFILFPNSKLPLRCRARAISSQPGLISTESDVPNKQTIVPWKVNAKEKEITCYGNCKDSCGSMQSAQEAKDSTQPAVH